MNAHDVAKGWLVAYVNAAKRAAANREFVGAYHSLRRALGHANRLVAAGGADYRGAILRQLSKARRMIAAAA